MSTPPQIPSATTLPAELSDQTRTVTARRGDIAVLEIRGSCAHLGRCTDPHLEYEVTRVTNVTRDGRVKGVEEGGWSIYRPTPLVRIHNVRHVYLVPATEVDVEAVIAEARAHTWPGHDQPCRYESFSDVQALIQRWRHAPVKPQLS